MDIVIFLFLLPDLMCFGSAEGNSNNENNVYRPFEGSIRTLMLRKTKYTHNTYGGEKEQNPNDPKYKETIEDVVYRHVGLKKENTKKITVTKIATQVTGVNIKNEFHVSLKSGKTMGCRSQIREKFDLHANRVTYQCSELDSKHTTAAAKPSATSKRYRADYVYYQPTDAFYKINRYLYMDARAVCLGEGAKLMAVESDEDLTLLHGIFKFPDIGNRLKVVGNHDGNDEVNSDEYPMIMEENRSDEGSCAVVNRQGEIESNMECTGYTPFVCKVPAKDAPYNEECDVYSKYYVSKISLTGSCYRIALIQVKWNEAYANCQAEGAHLAILNNEAEHEVVKQMIARTPRSDDKEQFFVGIRADQTVPVVFRTVFNQTLDKIGYQPWEEGEPNNEFSDEFGDEYCVTVRKRSGKYKNTPCRQLHFYICEKERRT